MAEVSNLTINVLANTDKATTNINNLVAALNKLKGVLKGVNPQLSRFATQMEKVKASLGGVTSSSNRASSSLKKIKTATKNVGENAKRTGENVRKAGESVKHIGEAAKKSSGGFGQLASSFKRILMYRMLRTLIKMITQALKEGVTNLYQWSKAMDSAGYGQFAKTMDSLATSFQYLKNSMGAMVSPLINALAPAINWVIDRFVDLLNVVNQVFAFLSGKSSWTRAKRVPTEFAEAAETASGAAKELRDVLADFDEINLIDPGKKGGGGGGSSSALEYEDMFEEVSGFDDIITKLQPLKDLLDEIMPIIKEIADWVAETLLPAVLEDVAFQIGNIFTDVTNIIDKIKEGDILGVLNEIKNLLVDLSLGPLEALATVFDAIFGTDVQGFIRDVMDAIKEFDLKVWLQDAWKTIQEMFDAFKEGGKFEKIGKEFKKIFEDLKKAVEDFADGIKTAWEEAIKPAIEWLWDLLKRFYAWLKESGILDWLVGAVNSVVEVFAAWAKTPFVTTLNGTVNGIKTLAALLSGDMLGAINGVKDSLTDLVFNVIQPFAETIDAIFGTNITEWFSNLNTAIKEFDLGAWIDDTEDKFEKFISVDVVSLYQAAFEYVKKTIIGLVDLAKGLWKGITEGDFSDWNAAAKEINITFGEVLDTVRAKNLEIYEQAQMKKIKIDAITGKKPDSTIAKLIQMPGGTKKQIKIQLKKDQETGNWSTITRLVQMPGGTKKQIIMQLKKDKNDAWSKEAYKVFNAATKGSSYTVNVNVKTTLKNKLAPKDIFNSNYINFRIGNNTVATAQIMGHGGYLNQGDLFIANESAPEYVGSMNGQTAVANNQQIVDGVASGVFRAIVSTGIVDAVKKNKNGSAPVFAPSVEAGRWIQRSLNLYQTVG